jgi:hypothetical protein
MKCKVANCVNQHEEDSAPMMLGYGVYFCSVCWEFITTGKGIYSQVYRNAAYDTEKSARG